MTANNRRRAASNVYVVYMNRMLVVNPLAALRGWASIVVMTTRAPAVILMMIQHTDIRLTDTCIYINTDTDRQTYRQTYR